MGPLAFLSTRKELSELLSKTPDLAGETERFGGGGRGGFGWLECFDCWGGCLFLCLMRGFLCQVFVNLEVASLFEDNYIHTKLFSVKPWHSPNKKGCNWEYDGSHQWWYCYCSYYCYYFYHYSYHFNRNVLVSISTFLIITIITIKSTKDDHLDYYWHYPLKLKKPLQR